MVGGQQARSRASPRDRPRCRSADGPGTGCETAPARCARYPAPSTIRSPRAGTTSSTSRSSSHEAISGSSIASRTRAIGVSRVRATSAVCAPLRIRILRRANGRTSAVRSTAGWCGRRLSRGCLHDPRCIRLHDHREGIALRCLVARGRHRRDPVDERHGPHVRADHLVDQRRHARLARRASAWTRSRSRRPLSSMSSQGRIVTPGSPARARASRSVDRWAGKAPRQVASLGGVRDHDARPRDRARPRPGSAGSLVASIDRSMTSMTRLSSTTRPCVAGREPGADTGSPAPATGAAAPEPEVSTTVTLRRVATCATAFAAFSSSRNASTKPRRKRPVPNWRTRRLPSWASGVIAVSSVSCAAGCGPAPGEGEARRARSATASPAHGTERTEPRSQEPPNSDAFSAVTIAVPVSTNGSTVSPCTTFSRVSMPSSPILAGNCATEASSAAGGDERDLVGQRVEAHQDDVLRRDARVGDRRGGTHGRRVRRRRRSPSRPDCR